MSELMTNQTIKHALLGKVLAKNMYGSCLIPPSLMAKKITDLATKLFIGICARDTSVYRERITEAKFAKNNP